MGVLIMKNNNTKIIKRNEVSNMKTKSWKNDLGDMRKELASLEKAFEAAYNPKLGTYELNKFNESLKVSGTTAG